MKDDVVFALDIGTRTVVGLLCRVAESGRINVENFHIEAHPQRSMLDGQIHDVGQVSKVIRRVKERLEQESGIVLDQAAIAAAGRALSTLKASCNLQFPTVREVSEQDVRHLEMKALGQAREQMTVEKSSFYCVGYSPIAYTLNQLAIANPVGQRGQAIGVEIIATFLPQVVVDSLFSALAKADLMVKSLTLEPIAAMSLAIPERLRMLNLALVDIGAGTSDIAVSRSGTIMAYAMVDKAGDEITEALAQQYLLDFNGAERLKMALNAGGQVEFTDVLGNRYNQEVSQVLEVINPVVSQLAETLAEKIKESNGGKAPAAVFCVGGGSQTPLLSGHLARCFELPEERIGIRTRENLEGIEFNNQEFSGPDIVTPLGIALTALKPQGEHFMQVQVNEHSVTLFNVQRSIVAQALLHSPIDVAEILGVRGPALEYTLNGNACKIPGEPGIPGQITVDNEAATLDTPIAPGARIEVAMGERGKQARCTLEELATKITPCNLSINDTKVTLPLIMKINGIPAQPDTVVSPGDRVEIRPPENVGEVAMLMDIDIEQAAVTVDAREADQFTAVNPDSVISFASHSPGTPSPAGDVPTRPVVTVNGQHVQLQPEQNQLMHALAQAEIDYSSARGRLVIHVNGQDADFSTQLRHGDKVEVFWTTER